MQPAPVQRQDEVFCVVDRDDRVLGYRTRAECHADATLIHRSVSAFDTVQEQVNEVKARLKNTEQELGKLKSESGIISVPEESLSLAAQRDRIMRDLDGTEAELASQKSLVDDLEKAVGAAEPVSQGDPEAEAVRIRPSNDEFDAFTEISERLKLLQKEDFELTAKFKEDNPLVVRNRQDIQRLKPGS